MCLILRCPTLAEFLGLLPFASIEVADAADYHLWITIWVQNNNILHRCAWLQPLGLMNKSSFRLWFKSLSMRLDRPVIRTDMLQSKLMEMCHCLLDVTIPKRRTPLTLAKEVCPTTLHTCSGDQYQDQTNNRKYSFQLHSLNVFVKMIVKIF